MNSNEVHEQPNYLVEGGNSGLKQFGGYVSEELLTNLHGPKAVKVFREMADNDATIGAILFTLKQTMRRVEWRVEAAEVPPELQERAQAEVEFVESLQQDMAHSWEDLVTEFLTMLEFGFAPHELVLKRRCGRTGDPETDSKFNDGLIGVRKLALRGQDTLLRWEFDDNLNLKGMWQLTWQGKLVYIPREKLVLFRTTKVKDNPEGRSILRNAYRAWYLKKRLETIEGIGIERDLAGLPVIKVPSELIQKANAGDPQAVTIYNLYKNMVRNLRRDEQEGVILPGDVDPKTNQPYFSLSLLATGGSRQVDVNTPINRYMQEMTMATLTDFVLLGHGARGTQALATTKVDVLMQAMQGYLDLAAEALNTQLLPLVWQLNGKDPVLMPRWKPDNCGKMDADRLAALIGALAQAGMPLFPDPDLESWVREQAGLPEPSPETRRAWAMAGSLSAEGQAGVGGQLGLAGHEEAAYAGASPYPPDPRQAAAGRSQLWGPMPMRQAGAPSPKTAAAGPAAEAELPLAEVDSFHGYDPYDNLYQDAGTAVGPEGADLPPGLGAAPQAAGWTKRPLWPQQH